MYLNTCYTYGLKGKAGNLASAGSVKNVFSVSSRVLGYALSTLQGPLGHLNKFQILCLLIT